jgi:hypothetical protein
MMDEHPNFSHHKVRSGPPTEQEPVRTTIVGARPPGGGRSTGAIPRGVEVLVKKASLDPEFRQLLLEKRADAADHIGLALDPAEAMMLSAVPADQLETIIARTSVPQDHRRVFLGKVAAAMLATIGLATSGCEQRMPATTGIAPDVPGETDPDQDEPDAPDEPGEAPSGSQASPPDRIPIQGIRPDPVPESKEGPS